MTPWKEKRSFEVATTPLLFHSEHQTLSYPFTLQKPGNKQTWRMQATSIHHQTMSFVEANDRLAKISGQLMSWSTENECEAPGAAFMGRLSAIPPAVSHTRDHDDLSRYYCGGVTAGTLLQLWLKCVQRGQIHPKLPHSKPHVGQFYITRSRKSRMIPNDHRRHPPILQRLFTLICLDVIPESLIYSVLQNNIEM